MVAVLALAQIDESRGGAKRARDRIGEALEEEPVDDGLREFGSQEILMQSAISDRQAICRFSCG